MPDPRYHAGVLQGIKLSCTPGGWPLEVPGLGPKRGGQPIDICVDCRPGASAFQRSTFVSYGGKALCKKHAVKRASHLQEETQRAEASQPT